MEFFYRKFFLLIYWTFVIPFLLCYAVIAEKIPVNFYNDSQLIQTYKQEICKLKDTCNIIDQIPQFLQDLRTRNCMCDEKCPYYKDCCRDANRTEADIGVKFVCTKTQFDGGVYMIQSCPEEWNGKSIQEKCLAQNSTLLSYDILSKLPVTSTTNGITYSNVFCAICNEEKNYDFWNIGFTYELSGSKNSHSLIGVRDILAKLSFNQTGQMIWSSYVNESFYKCYLEPKVHSRITSLRYCIPDVIRSCQNGKICEGFTSYIYSGGKIYKNLGCAKCNDRKEELKGCLEDPNNRKFYKTVTEISVTDSLLPKVHHCDDFPKSTPAHEFLCENDASETRHHIEDCYAAGKEPFCHINKYYHRGHNDFYYVNNETVFIHEYNMEFPENEWVALDDDKIYVCGHQIPRTKYQRIMFSINNITTEVLIKISIFCIVLHLLTFWHHPELQNLSGKNLASLCVALLTALISLEIGPWLPSCEIVAIITHYSILSCFSWMLVISYDIWLGIYRATVKLCSSNKKRHSKYLIYSTVAWILPIFAVGPAIYAEFSPSDVVSCDFKPGYGKLGQCFIGVLKPHLYFFLCPTLVIFMANICFFSHTAYLIYSARRGSVNPVKRHDFKVYFRLGLLMGLTWTLGLFVALTHSELLALLFTVFNMSQGIFIFFEFTFDGKIIKKLLQCQESTNVSEQTEMESF